MSQDSYIFLKTECFPHSTWRQVLEFFCAKEREALLWVVEQPVWLSVQEVGARHWQFGRYRWEIGIHYQAPYDVHKLWTTVAVPYHCLVLMEQATYHGPDPDGEPIIDDACEFERYAKRFLIVNTSLQKLVKHGFMDAEENLILDAAHNKPLHATAQMRGA